MTTESPFGKGLTAYAEDLRNGQADIVDCVKYCLQRIDKYDSHLQAFQHLDAEGALKTAQALQDLLQSGTDLGPLMGVPVGIKDIIAVEGMPTTNGSLFEAELPGPADASIVSQLRRAGCIIIGKTKTVEFALGATGMNAARGTPRNPNDWDTHRLPGGSSSGSAVAVAAGFTGFALGTDTGGSIRIPASFNGIFGHKTSVGLWPTDGAFPLSPTLDSIGPLCRTAADAGLIHHTLFNKDASNVTTTSSANAAIKVGDLSGVSLAIPKDLFFDELDPAVVQAFDAALEKIRAAGATVVDTQLPEAHERGTLFPQLVPPELLHALGRERFAEAALKMDPVTRQRAEFGLGVYASDYFSAKARHDELATLAEQKLAGLDGWITPTCPFPAMTVDSLSEQAMHERSLLSSRNTQPGNLMKLCASSLPIHHLINNDAGTEPLPIGLQLMCRFDDDEKLLELSQRLQAVLGISGLPELPE